MVVSRGVVWIVSGGVVCVVSGFVVCVVSGFVVCVVSGLTTGSVGVSDFCVGSSSGCEHAKVSNVSMTIRSIVNLCFIAIASVKLGAKISIFRQIAKEMDEITLFLTEQLRISKILRKFAAAIMSLNYGRETQIQYRHTGVC